MKFALALLMSCSLLALPAAAQKSYGAVIDAAQETPPPPGPPASGGWARVSLTPAGALTYEVRTFGLAATMAHIHMGAVGVPGGIVFVLAGGPSVFTGTTAVLTPAQLADLQAGLYYINVHTMANPGGEIRGQLLPSPRVFGAHLDNTQEPSVSTAKGDGFFTLNPDNSLTYLVTTTGLFGGISAHIHIGAFGGAPGGIEVPLLGGPTTWSGTSVPLSSGQIDNLQTLNYYANVHTMALPGGAIRGQIVPSCTEIFNSPSAQWAHMLTMTVTGTPSDMGGGGLFTISITGGKPSGAGLMLVSFSPAASMLQGQPFLVNAATPIGNPIALALNGAGALTLPAPTPTLTVSFDFTLQFFGLDTTAPNGKFNPSNAVVIRLQHF